MDRAVARVLPVGDADLGADALLVCLAPGQGEYETLGREAEVADVNSRDFRAAEGGGKAEEHDRPVPQRAEGIVLREGSHRVPQDVEGGGGLLGDGPTVRAGDALHDVPDLRRLGVEVEAPDAVGAGNGHQARPQGGILQGGRTVGQEKPHGRFGGRQGLELPLLAPGGEVGPGGAVGAPGVLRGRGRGVGGRALGEGRQVGREGGRGVGCWESAHHVR